MKYVDLKALLLGGILAYIGRYIILIVAAFGKAELIGLSHIPPTVFELLWLIFIQAITYFWAGYIIEVLSNKRTYLTPLIYGFFLLITSDFSSRLTLPSWYKTVSLLMIMPAVLIGAYVAFKYENSFLQKHNSNLNKDCNKPPEKDAL